MKQALITLSGNKQGFTLVELLVALAIVGVISGVMVNIISMVRNTTGESTAQSLMMSQVNQAANWIARDIESAGSVTGTSGNVLCAVTRYVWNGTDMGTSENISYEVTSGNILLRKVNGSASGTPVAQFISYPPGIGNYTIVTSENNTYIIKLRSVYSNGEEYKQQYKVSRRIPP